MVTLMATKSRLQQTKNPKTEEQDDKVGHGDEMTQAGHKHKHNGPAKLKGKDRT